MINKQIEAMRKIGLSEEEITELLKADKAVDKGANPYPLTADQEKVSKEARQVSKEPTVFKLDNAEGKRNKKVDDDKRFLVNALIIGLCDCIGMDANKDISVLNAEREFTFTYNNRKFKITLSAPRT